MSTFTRALAAVAVAVLALAGTATPVTAEPRAAGADFAFDVTAPLPTFPCPNCGTSMNGTVHATGNATGGTVPTNVDFAVLGASLSGSAQYTEAGPPLCPVHGSAKGSVGFTASGAQATGVAYQPTGSGAFHTGIVTGVSGTVNFEYQRIGAVATVAVVGGSVTLRYQFPGTGEQSFTVPVTAFGGGGVAAFRADPVLLVQRCLQPGPLEVEVIGNVSVAFAGV